MAKAYITVEHHDDGTKTVVDHKTRTAAHAHGQALRKAGKHVYAHPKEAADRLGLDPRGPKIFRPETPHDDGSRVFTSDSDKRADKERQKIDASLTKALTPPTRKEIEEHARAGSVRKDDHGKFGGDDLRRAEAQKEVDDMYGSKAPPASNPHSYSKGDVIPPMKHRETPEEAARYEAHKAASSANKPATTPWSADANRLVNEGDKHAAKTGILTQNPSHAMAAQEAANASSIAKGASNRTSGDRLHTHTVAANAHAAAVQAHTTALAAAKTPKQAAIHKEAIESHRQSLAMHSKKADQAANAKSDAKKWAESKTRTPSKADMRRAEVAKQRAGAGSASKWGAKTPISDKGSKSDGGSYSHWKGGGK